MRLRHKREHLRHVVDGEVDELVRWMFGDVLGDELVAAEAMIFGPGLENSDFWREEDRRLARADDLGEVVPRGGRA